MTNILTTHGLAAALFIAAQSTGYCQEDLSPDEIVKPNTAKQGSGTIKGSTKNRNGIGAVTVDGADVTLASPVPPPAVKRAGRYVSSREDVPPVVVQFSEKSDAVDALQEDLTIMALRIRKAMDESTEDDVLTKPDAKFFRRTSGGYVRTMYVEGFGALIFVKASFPLLGAPAEQPAPYAAADSEWNRAKQDLLAERRKALALDSMPGQPFNAAQVETLKNQILSAMKDATNIRSIKPTDSVAVTVFGPPAAAAGKVSLADVRGTVLTIRVKKSDIDAFAADKLDLDKFKQNASITTYVGNGYGVTSVNSWAKSSSLQVR